MEEQKNDQAHEELQILTTFLECTAEGKYAPIEEGSLSFSRAQEETYLLYDEYYYSFS